MERISRSPISDAVAIATLTEKLQPILIALNAEDKKNLAKLGEKSVAFVENQFPKSAVSGKNLLGLSILYCLYDFKKSLT